MYYLMIFSAALLLALDFILLRKYQKFNGSSPKSGFFYNAVKGLCTSFIFIAINKFRIEFTWYSVALAALFALFCFLYVVLGIKVISSGGVAVYSLFLMGGGMTVPYICGIIFFGEKFSVLRTAGLLLILCAMVLTGGKIKAVNLNTLFFCIAIFLLNGTVGIFSKLQQSSVNFETVSSTGFVVLSSLSSLIMSNLALLFSERKDILKNFGRNVKKFALPKPMFIIFLSGAAGGISFYFQLISLKNLPVTVQFPFLTGGSIILTALISQFIFKEKSDKRIWLGIFLCFAGTLLFL